MAVEKLLNRDSMQIRELQIQEGERRPLTESMKLYDALKETDLYDNDTKLWKHYIVNGTNYTDNKNIAFDQLLSVMVDTLFDTDNGLQRYTELKQSELYNSEAELWEWRLKGKHEKRNFSPRSDSQLMGVFIESQYDKDSAYTRYTDLKQTYLYDDKNNRWKNEEDEIGNVAYTADHLLEILVEAQFDKNNAKELYKLLKQTPAYDEEHMLWHDTLTDLTLVDLETQIYSSDQILGVLVESMFDNEKAREQYYKLKQTQLFDSRKQQWVWFLHEDLKGSHGYRFADAQLLGVWAEHTFEEKEQEFTNEAEFLPEMRRF